MAIREALWDCQYCGAKGIPGRHKSCPNCGTSRPHGTKFYLPEKAAEVKDNKLIEEAKIGPDWVCDFCGTSNAANRTTCRSCGAERGAAVPTQRIEEYHLGEAPKKGDMDFSEKVRDGAANLQGEQQGRKLPWPLIIGIGALLLLLLCAVPAIINAVAGGPRDVTIGTYYWERTAEVEALRTFTEEDWEVPQGARIISQQEAIHHYDQILVGYDTRTRQVPEQIQVGTNTYVCGQRDLGNGYFEDIQCTDPVYETQYRSETYDEPVYNSIPVYRTKYTYEVDRWVTVRTERESGNNREPVWPEISLAENEREGDKTELYTITFLDEKGDAYKMEYPFEQWLNFEPDHTYTLEVDGFGNAERIVDQ